MKKAVLLLAILSCAGWSGFSQGYVSFSNNGLVAGNPPSVLVLNLDGSPLVGTNWVAQLYYGAWGSPESSLIAVANPPAYFRLPTTSLPGTWVPGGRTLDRFSGNDVVGLQVKVWDSALFPTYEMALGAGGITGKSILFNYTICPPGSCGGPNPYAMYNFVGFTLRNSPGPLLSVLFSRGGNQIVLAWPTNVVGFTLQSSPSLGPDATWTDCTNATIAGDQYLMITNVSTTNQFYRLKK